MTQNALHLRVIAAPGDPDDGLCGGFGHDAVDAPDKGTGGIHTGVATVRQRPVDLRTGPVGAQHYGGARRRFLGGGNDGDAAFGQLLDRLPVVDKLPQRAGGAERGALLSQLQRPLHPKAGTGGSGDGDLHPLTPVFSRIYRSRTATVSSKSRAELSQSQASGARRMGATSRWLS